MKAIHLLLIFAVLLISAHRLPAPIVEEKPAPAPEQSAKPKPKRTIKPKVTSEDSESSPKAQTFQKRLGGSSSSSFIIPKSQMTASATSQHSGYEASKAIDGNSQTIWHTAFGFFSQPLVPLPQSIVLNLGGTYNINALHYTPRQDEHLQGVILSYRVYVSTDGSRFTLLTVGNWTDDHTEKTATFAPTRASYIRLEAAAGHGGYASAAELTVSAAQ